MQRFTVFFVMLYMVMCQALTPDWDDKIAVLYPSLPIVAPWSENKSCRNHSRMLLQALNNFTLWAVQMLDSSARQPSGVLFGNVYQLGNFDECLEINGPVESQYCLAKVTAKVPDTDTIIDPFIQNYDPASSVWDKIKNDGNPVRMPRSNVYQALCVPASCSPQDIETAVSQYLQKYKHPAGVQYTVAVAPNLCHTSQQEAFSFEDYIFLGVMAGVVMLVIAGTALDYVFGSSQPGTLYLDLLFCFSARQNMRRLNQKSTSYLDSLKSIQFICACIIIFIHRGASFVASPLWNLEFLEKEYQTVRLSFLQLGVLVVDSFFVISGSLGVIIQSKEELSVVKCFFEQKPSDADKFEDLYKQREAFRKTYGLFGTVATFECSTTCCESSFSTVTAVNRPQRIAMTHQRMAD